MPGRSPGWNRTNRAHGKKVKIYYTVRELTSRLPELWALRSLGDEVLAGGPGGGFARAFSNQQLYNKGGRFTAATSAQKQQAAKLNVVYRGSLFLYGILILLGLSLVGMAIPLIWIIRLRPARVLSME